MTYQELLTELQSLTPEQLEAVVTVHDTSNDEYFLGVARTEDDDNNATKPGFLFLVINS